MQAILFRLAILIVVLATALAPTVSLAQDTSPAAAAERQIVDLSAELESVARDLQLPEQTAQTLAEKRTVSEQIRAKTRQAAAALRAPIADLDTRLKQLGPAPAAGAPEAAAIASQRLTLDRALEKFNAAERQLTLLAVEAEQLSARISAMQRDRFVQQIFESSRSIFNPVLWWEGARSLALVSERLMTLLSVWYADVSTRSSPGLLALALAAIAA
ncbi:MAG: DUF3772 domain-containing protein, partial [Pseudomonadota bacterium]|nr:DUF3772 domain-containing protein [Pseudomonadota bacterium]